MYNYEHTVRAVNFLNGSVTMMGTLFRCRSADFKTLALDNQRRQSYSSICVEMYETLSGGLLQTREYTF